MAWRLRAVDQSPCWFCTLGTVAVSFHLTRAPLRRGQGLHSNAAPSRRYRETRSQLRRTRRHWMHAGFVLSSLSRKHTLRHSPACGIKPSWLFRIFWKLQVSSSSTIQKVPDGSCLIFEGKNSSVSASGPSEVIFQELKI